MLGVDAGAGPDRRQVQATLVGEQNADMFSWVQPVATDEYLWTSDPMYGLIRSDVAKLETGRVFGYRLGSEFPRNGTVAEPASGPAAVCILGDAPKGRLGATMVAVPGTTLLAIAASHSYLQSRLSGAVYLVSQ